MVKCGEFTYDGQMCFDAIKATILKDNRDDEIRYSFMLHYDERLDNDEPKNAAIISYVVNSICEVFKCESCRDYDIGSIGFCNFKLGDSDAWHKINTVLGRSLFIKLGIDEVNITNRIYNFRKG